MTEFSSNKNELINIIVYFKASKRKRPRELSTSGGLVLENAATRKLDTKTPIAGGGGSHWGSGASAGGGGSAASSTSGSSQKKVNYVSSFSLCRMTEHFTNVMLLLIDLID